jgi:hypothetical protein
MGLQSKAKEAAEGIAVIDPEVEETSAWKAFLPSAVVSTCRTSLK